MVPPVKEIEASVAAGAKVGVPQPLVETPVGLATTMDAGNVSLKATLVCEITGEGLVIVNVKTEVPFSKIALGEKDLLMVGS